MSDDKPQKPNHATLLAQLLARAADPATKPADLPHLTEAIRNLGYAAALEQGLPTILGLARARQGLEEFELERMRSNAERRQRRNAQAEALEDSLSLEGWQALCERIEKMETELLELRATSPGPHSLTPTPATAVEERPRASSPATPATTERVIRDEAGNVRRGR